MQYSVICNINQMIVTITSNHLRPRLPKLCQPSGQEQNPPEMLDKLLSQDLPCGHKFNEFRFELYLNQTSGPEVTSFSSQQNRGPHYVFGN